MARTEWMTPVRTAEVSIQGGAATANPGTALGNLVVLDLTRILSGPQAGGKQGHVFVINLENKGYSRTWGTDSPAPYLSRTLRS